jgi:hypothetical protein
MRIVVADGEPLGKCKIWLEIKKGLAEWISLVLSCCVVFD